MAKDKDPIPHILHMDSNPSIVCESVINSLFYILSAHTHTYMWVDENQKHNEISHHTHWDGYYKQVSEDMDKL